MPGKNSTYVCQFFKNLRRYFPNTELWVALDQDSAHPKKSRITRKFMRELKIHWISLPKGSPDDNPVETLFSDVQLIILDNSNDQTPNDTKQRITNYFRARNKRKNRWIHIPYLNDSHNH